MNLKLLFSEFFKNVKIKNKKIKGSKKAKIITGVIVLLLFCVYGSFVLLVRPNFKSKKIAQATEISKELVKTKQYQGLTISDISMEDTSSLTHLMANINNTGTEVFPEGIVYIIFLNKKNDEIGREMAYISKIEAKGTIRIDTAVDSKYKTAYNFKVEAKES